MLVEQLLLTCFRLWNEVACDYDLDVSKHVAFACVEAASMIGRCISISEIDGTMPSYLHSALPCSSFGVGLHRHSKRATVHPRL